jgi:hypothetical protein
MTNYICINGKKAELTEEQMKALGIELPKVNPFKRVEMNKPFYRLGYDGDVYIEYERCSNLTNDMFNVANYCTDKAIMEQRALHETLNRLLWRYSMEHGGDKIDWDNVSDKWTIYYDNDINKYKATCWQTIHYFGNIYFLTENIALAAIKEIIEPFMKAHPDFKW